MTKSLLVKPGVLILGANANRYAARRSPLGDWQSDAATYARILSGVQWAPVTTGMPRHGGTFNNGQTYTGIPYSRTRFDGRVIGFDVSLRTFLAAVQNPVSVLYTVSLAGGSGIDGNGSCYYGNVCSNLTSYSYQNAFYIDTAAHLPARQSGVAEITPASAAVCQVGDFIYTGPSGAHTEIVTEVVLSGETVTHVRTEDSWPPTCRNNYRTAAATNTHLSGKKLCRISDLNAWRDWNRAERYNLPNFTRDAATPTINRALLLDYGDWVPYHKADPVKFNVMDRDAAGVASLILKRGATTVETIPITETGVVERTFSTCGEYTAHCVMDDSSESQACEFAVCELTLSIPATKALTESWTATFTQDNIVPVALCLWAESDIYDRVWIPITSADRLNGMVSVPANTMSTTGTCRVWVVGEHVLGRLFTRQDITLT